MIVLSRGLTKNPWLPECLCPAENKTARERITSFDNVFPIFYIDIKIFIPRHLVKRWIDVNTLVYGRTKTP